MLARLQMAIESSGDVVYDWDLASDSLAWSGVAASLFGSVPGSLPATGDELHGRVNPEDLPQRMQALSEHFTGLQSYDCEYRVRGDAGQFHWVHDRGAVSLSPTGTPERMVGVLRLVTHRKQQEARLEYLANFDELTGHFNKLRLRDTLDQALAQGELAQRLEGTLRATDVIGRLDSDRFGIVLAGYDAAQAHRAAERILQAIRSEPFAIANRQIHISASAGIVMYPTHSQTTFDVITKGEGALLKAKQAGRDCFSVYQLDEARQRDQLAHLTIAEDVKRALRKHQLILAYQPVVDAKSEEVQFHECLLRMRGPGGALISAQRFVPVAERMGLVRSIDRRVLELAVRDLQAYPQVALAINISGMTATDRSWLRALSGHLRGRPDLARRLIIEITETAALHDIEESAHFVSTVRDLGCRVAVDDFGAGYTTFRHLKSLTVDIVKIDGSFVRDIATSPENQLFIRNLLSLARSFGLKTVAECVEHGEDAAYFRNEGLDRLQGYHFGKPRVKPSWKSDQDAATVAAGTL
jgi:predicted signal transduction protein with EAL and GGDEF domain